MKVQDIEVGKAYHIIGDIENGYINGKPNISHEEVTRTIRRVTEAHVFCECGRRFLINNNLKLSEIKKNDLTKREAILDTIKSHIERNGGSCDLTNDKGEAMCSIEIGGIYLPVRDLSVDSDCSPCFLVTLQTAETEELQKILDYM